MPINRERLVAPATKVANLLDTHLQNDDDGGRQQSRSAERTNDGTHQAASNVIGDPLLVHDATTTPMVGRLYAAAIPPTTSAGAHAPEEDGD